MINQFIQERKYLKAVTPKTLAWYKDAFRAFEGATESEDQIKQRIFKLRERGIKPVSVNSWLRVLKAYYKWQSKEWTLSQLKEEQKILETLPVQDVRAILAFKPIGVNLRRAHAVALTILDTGLRASEVLGLTVENVDLDNCTFKVLGKGGKHRLVPFSVELRKVMYRNIVQPKLGRQRRLVFGTKNDTQVSVRNLERDFKILGKKLGISGIRFSPHTLRHTFSVIYLRNGGNLEYLRRIMGHSNLSTTQKYLRSLGVADLGLVHNQLSPLCKNAGLK